MRFLLLPVATLLTIWLFSGCVSFSEDKEAAELHLKVGVGHMNSGNYPQALAEMLRAEKLDPNSPLVQNHLGLAYAARDRLDLAEMHLQKAVNLKEEYSEAHNNLGRVLTERGKYIEAAREIQKVLDDLTYPHPDQALTNMGVIKFKMGEFQTAKIYLQKALAIQRENCLAQTYFGRCFYELKDYRRSAETLDKAVGYCQRLQFDEPQYYSGLSYYQLGERPKAENRLESLIKLYPDGKYVEKAKTALGTMRR